MTENYHIADKKKGNFFKGRNSYADLKQLFSVIFYQKLRIKLIKINSRSQLFLAKGFIHEFRD